jgi:hypothetical protein
MSRRKPKPSEKRTFTVTVTGESFDTYEIEADSHDEAEKLGRAQFKDDRPECAFDDIQAVAEHEDDE